MEYVSGNNLDRSKQDRSTLGVEPGHSRNFDRSNLPTNAMYEKCAQKMPNLSPRTLLSCFAIHDETIKEKIEAELSNKRQMSSGRKTYCLKTYSNSSTLNNYMNFHLEYIQ